MSLSRAASHTAFLHDAGAGRQHPRWHPRRETLGSCGQTIIDACWTLVEGADDNEAGCHAPEECNWGALWGPDTWPHNTLESLLEGKQGVLSGVKDGKNRQGQLPRPGLSRVPGATERSRKPVGTGNRPGVQKGALHRESRNLLLFQHCSDQLCVSPGRLLCPCRSSAGSCIHEAV